MKVCSQCKIEKNINEFRFRTDTKKYRNKCLSCENYNRLLIYDKERKRQYNLIYREKNRDRLNMIDKKEYEENREQKILQARKYRLENKEKINERDRKRYYEDRKDKMKEYYAKNKNKMRGRINKYYNQRIKTDNNFKLKELIRGRFRSALNFYSKNGKTKSMKEYGIDIKIIVEKLGQPPQDDKKYHIDHIFPVSAFDLNDAEHIKLCWHPDNLQWLEASENISKNNKYDLNEFQKYLATGQIGNK